MKRLKGFTGLLLATVMVFALAACGPSDSAGNNSDKETPSGPESTTEESFVFSNELGDFSISIPGRFELIKTEELTDTLKGHIYQFKSGDEVLEISDIEFPGVEVNEALIEEEMEMGGGLEITRMDNITVPGQGTFYGALVHDTAMDRYVFYHRIAKDERIISFLQSRAVPYSLEEEAQNKAMLGTLKFT